MISRAEAKALGLKRYFTGKPCIYGHLNERNTASTACLQCQARSPCNVRKSDKHPDDWARELAAQN